jgi:putative cell wall-binding protein
MRTRVCATVLVLLVALITPATGYAANTQVTTSFKAAEPGQTINELAIGAPVTYNGVTEPIVAWNRSAAGTSTVVMVRHGGLPGPSHIATASGAALVYDGNFTMGRKPMVVGRYVYFFRHQTGNTNVAELVRWDLQNPSAAPALIFRRVGLRPMAQMFTDGTDIVWVANYYGTDSVLYRIPNVSPSTVLTVTAAHYQPIMSASIWRTAVDRSQAINNFSGTDTSNVFRTFTTAANTTQTITHYSGPGVNNSDYGVRWTGSGRDWIYWREGLLAPNSTARAFDTLTSTAATLFPGYTVNNDVAVNGGRAVTRAWDPAQSTNKVVRRDVYSSTSIVVTSAANTLTKDDIRGRRLVYGTKPVTGESLVQMVEYRIATDRVGGGDRFAVAAAAARRSYPTGFAGVTHVIVASGADAAVADPLAAGGLCWKYDAPLVLVSPTSIPGSSDTLLRQIKAQSPAARVIVVGGAGSVPDARIAQLKALFGSTRVERLLATGDRYDMAAAIAYRMKFGAGGRTFPVTPNVLVANGENPATFFEALAMSAVSRNTGFPLLLVRRTSVPNATLSSIRNVVKPKNVYMAGDDSSVASTLMNTLFNAVATINSVERWCGNTREQTIRSIAESAIQKRYLRPCNVAFAAKLPDALSGGAATGRQGGPILLTYSSGLPVTIAGWLADWYPEVDSAAAYGGTVSVTPAAVTQIDSILAR